MPLLIDFEEIGIIPRPKRDNRPAKKVFVDRANGMLVVDKDRYRLWLEEQKRANQAASLSNRIGDGPSAEESPIDAKKLLRRTKPPFGSSDNPRPEIVVFNRRASLT